MMMNEFDLSPVAGTVSSALTQHLEKTGGLETELLAGAWEIALVAQGAAQKALLSAVLGSAGAEDLDDLDERIAATAYRIPEPFRADAAVRLERLFREDPDRATSALREVPPDVVVSLVGATEDRWRKEHQRFNADQGDEEDVEAFNQRREKAKRWRTALAEIATALGPDHRAAAEAVLVPLVKEGSGPAFDPLQALAPAQSEALVVAVLDRSRFRLIPRRAEWLALVSSDRAASIRPAFASSAASQAWEQMDALDPDQLHELLTVIDSLRGTPGWELERKQTTAPPTDAEPETVTAYFRRADVFAEIGCIDENEVANARIREAHRQLEGQPGIHRDDAEALVVECVTSAVGTAEDEAVAMLEPALADAGWLEAIPHARLRMRVDSALVQRDVQRQHPLSPQLAAQYLSSFGTEVAEEVAGWLDQQAPEPDVVWPIVEGSGSTRPGVIRAALSRLAERTNAAGRLALAQPSIDRHRLDDQLLDDLRFHDADEIAASEWLVGLYEQATNNPDRERVLGLWRALRPTQKDARRLLIAEVLTPMATENQAALELVLRDLDLAREPPRGTLQNLRAAIKDGGKKFKRKDRARDRLVDLGFVRKGGILSRDSEDDSQEVD